MSTNTKDDWFERWWAAMPEPKLELIDGKLIISTLAGSRRIMFELLKDYGPGLVLPMASTELWWRALREAYSPQPRPEMPAEWLEWVDSFDYEPDVAPAGPRGSAKHRRMQDVLRWGLHHFAEATRLGRSFGPDFVIRLGEDGPTPDVIFIDRDRLANLRDRYLEGPPAIAIEIVLEGSEDQDRILKRRLYEQGGVPEYWLVQPEELKITFYRLQSDGRYEPLVIGPQELQRIVDTKEDRIYESVAVPGLSQSLLQLWTMEEHSWKDPWRPFLPVGGYPDELPRLRDHDEGITWDSIPFAPRADLEPVLIHFAEYISWCGRAKFERYGGGLKIDGTEGTRRVAGMLLMTLGLTEVVKLAHPREWVVFLDRDKHQATVQQRAEPFMRHAKYDSHEFRKDEIFYHGEIPQLPDVSGYGDTPNECEQDLRKVVEGWILLRIARREEIPRAD
ncbi:MAG: Uma2 family endonuclease [Anaerolineae bacterium]